MTWKQLRDELNNISENTPDGEVLLSFEDAIGFSKLVSWKFFNSDLRDGGEILLMDEFYDTTPGIIEEL